MHKEAMVFKGEYEFSLKRKIFYIIAPDCMFRKMVLLKKTHLFFTGDGFYEDSSNTD